MTQIIADVNRNAAGLVCRGVSALLQVTPPTGEPDAGDPHVRFGRRAVSKPIDAPYLYPSFEAQSRE